MKSSQLVSHSFYSILTLYMSDIINLFFKLYFFFN